MTLADVTSNVLPNSLSSTANPASALSHLLNTLILLILVIGGITFVFMLLFGGYQWITSGGDKEGLAKAKNRITHAVVGLIILFSIFALLSLFGDFLGINLTSFNLPS
jgi:hypothetical protein